MTFYYEATDEVINIAKRLIEKHHKPLGHAKIGFIFRDKATMKNGRSVLATAKKPPPWLSVYKPLDFLIEVAREEWNILSADQRVALIDHELCHCGYDPDEEKTWLNGHDFEEFEVIIKRRGFWNFSLLKATKTFKEALQSEFEGFKEAKIDGEVVAVNPQSMTEPVG